MLIQLNYLSVWQKFLTSRSCFNFGQCSKLFILELLYILVFYFPDIEEDDEEMEDDEEKEKVT